MTNHWKRRLLKKKIAENKISLLVDSGDHNDDEVDMDPPVSSIKSVAEALNLVDELTKFALAQLHDEDLYAPVEIFGKKLEDAKLSQQKHSAIQSTLVIADTLGTVIWCP